MCKRRFDSNLLEMMAAFVMSGYLKAVMGLLMTLEEMELPAVETTAVVGYSYNQVADGAVVKVVAAVVADLVVVVVAEKH